MIHLLVIIPLFITLVSFLYNTLKPRENLVPPGPPGLPLIGNLHQLATATHLHLYLWQLSNKYGPLMHMKLGSVPLLVISSSKLAKEVLKTQESSFCSRPNHTGQRKLSYNGLDIAFSPYNDYWREVRKITAIHLFSHTKIQSFRPVREDEISRMVERVKDHASSQRALDLNEMTTSLFSMLICRIAFGKRYDEQGYEMRRFDELLHEAQAMMAAFFVADYFPSLRCIDQVSGLMDRLERIFTKCDVFYEEIINERLDDSKKEEKIDKVDDILDVLIALTKQKSSAVELSRESIKALLMDIFVAGTDTSAASVVWTMFALMKAPSVLQKLQAEIRGSISKKPLVTEDDLLKLPYLKAVICESLRLYPSDPMLLPRETTNKCVLEGYEIKPKTTVYINAWAVARDPEYWESPNEFMPERFLDKNVDVKGQDFGVIPFGSGRRMCPGMSMGLVNVELTIANLLYNFDWDFPQGVRAQDIDEDLSPGITMYKKNPLLLVPRRVFI